MAQDEAPLDGDYSDPPPLNGIPNEPRLKDGEGFVQGLSRLDQAKTTEDSVEYTNPDGSTTVHLSQEPVRFKTDDGQWHDFDFTLQTVASAKDATRVAAVGSAVVASPDDLVASASDSPVAISADPSAGAVARLAIDAGLVTVGVPVEAGDLARARVDEKNPRVARFMGDKGVDVLMALGRDGLEQSVEIGSATGPSSYEVTITVPDGVVARPAKSGVEFIGDNGQVVGSFGDGVAHDAARGGGALAPVTTELIDQVKNATAIRVSVDAKWFNDDSRVFPVTIDPWYFLDPRYPDDDTFADSSNPDGHFSTYSYLRSGRYNLAIPAAYGAALQFHGLPTGPNLWLAGARIKIFNNAGWSDAAKSFDVSGTVADFYPPPVTFNGMYPAPDHYYPQYGYGYPDTDETIPVNTSIVPASPNGTGGCNCWTYLDAYNAVAKQFNAQNAWLGLVIEPTDGNDGGSGKEFYSHDSGASGPVLELTWKHMPNQVTPNSPIADAVLADITPALKVNVPSSPGPDSTSVSYQFQVATGADGRSGSVIVSSGWLAVGASATTKSWTVPANYLDDGATYYWTVWVKDEDGVFNIPDWSRKLRVNLRLGTSSPSPYDVLGPANVNLATGNLAVSTSSPSMPAVGGDIGFSYMYNTLAPTIAGLTGDYFTNMGLTGNPATERRDTTMLFDWQATPPPVGPEHWSARWTGYVTATSTGTYKFTVLHDDGVRIWINNVLVLDAFLSHSCCLDGSASFSLTNNVATAIKIEYYNDTGPASLDVRLHKTNVDYTGVSSLGSPGTPKLAVDAPVLPAGWQVSTDLDGNLPYVSLKNNHPTMSLMSGDGRTDSFNWNGSMYVPDAGIKGSVLFTCDTTACWFDYNSGSGLLERFRLDGQIDWVRSTTDDRKPAAAEYEYTTIVSGQPQRLTKVTDPVANRYIALHYQGESGFSCPTLTGYDSTPPSGMLCQINYSHGGGNNGWGANAGNTSFYYKTKYLALIQDPGHLDLSDGDPSNDVGFPSAGFQYDAYGRLEKLLDPDAYDFEAESSSENYGDQIKSIIAYKSATDNRVLSVTAPEPNPVAGTPNVDARQVHTYTYTSGQAVVKGLFPGAPPVSRTVRTVTYDAQLHMTSSKDATNHLSSQTWDIAADSVARNTDPAGMTSTTVFDELHRPIEQYGPAPTACFGTDNKPLSPLPSGQNCPSTVPKVATQLDGGLNGLAASWWNSDRLTGSPIAHSLWAGDGTNASSNFGYSSPVPGTVSVDNFSGVLTGAIYLPASSSSDRWWFKADSDDGMTVTIDNTTVINSWEIPLPWGNIVAGKLPTAVTTAGWHPITVTYQEKGGAASLRFVRALGPDGPTQPSTFSDIPVTHLTPRYDLVTSTTDPDNHTTTISYSGANGIATGIGPQYGLPVFTTVDPGSSGHLNLTSATDYEPPTSSGDSYLRPKQMMLPLGVASHTGITTSYYGDTETINYPTTSNGCYTGTGYPQAGFAKLVTDPTPSTGVSAPYREMRYNRQGRVAFSKQGGDADWSCNVYDLRGRLTKTIAADSSIVSTDYSDPLVTDTSYTDPQNNSTLLHTIAETDLLGRTTSYIDEQGTKSETVYDIAGRAIERWRTLPGGTRTKIWWAYGYDDDGRLTATREYISVVAGRDTWYTYDSAGRPYQTSQFQGLAGSSSVVLTTAASYESTSGRASTKSATPVTGLWWEILGYTPAGKRSFTWDYTNDGTGTTSRIRTPSYDPAGRLASVVQTSPTAYGTLYKYDDNANRQDVCLGIGSPMVYSCNLGPSYLYDAADRLVSSPGRSAYTYDDNGNQPPHGNVTDITLTAGSPIHIDYDVYDHATLINDGTTKTEEWLSPSGRVLRRRVTQLSNNTVTEDLQYGYANSGDSPSWTKPSSGGSVTTYAGGAIIVGTSLSYQVSNSHGDIVATVSSAGVLASQSRTDEFGVGTVPSTRLGYLGAAERFATSSTLGILRMGMRLYDPVIGRFLETDPVVGGSCNDYDYVCQDPINQFDLNGAFLGLDCDICDDAVDAVHDGYHWAQEKLYGRGEYRNPLRVNLGRSPAKILSRKPDKLVRIATRPQRELQKAIWNRIWKRDWSAKPISPWPFLQWCKENQCWNYFYQYGKYVFATGTGGGSGYRRV